MRRLAFASISVSGIRKSVLASATESVHFRSKIKRISVDRVASEKVQDFLINLIGIYIEPLLNRSRNVNLSQQESGETESTVQLALLCFECTTCMIPRARARAVSSVLFINDHGRTLSLRAALAFRACGRINLSRGIWESDRRQISDATESRAECRDGVGISSLVPTTVVLARGEAAAAGD